MENPFSLPTAPQILRGDRLRSPLALPHNVIVILLQNSTKEYPLKNGKTTYYVCQGHRCLPPTNDFRKLI
ncbi:MAG: hypothetical protein E7609_06575 [Ruminococcaceae bacterium]|nr:hypothetical protein [Oscillospiraceae bacterium]